MDAIAYDDKDAALNNIMELSAICYLLFTLVNIKVNSLSAKWEVTRIYISIGIPLRLFDLLNLILNSNFGCKVSLFL